MTRPDVLIVGGGVIGCAVAYELAKERLRVTLLERDGLCAGASGANGALIWPQAMTRGVALEYRRTGGMVGRAYITVATFPDDEAEAAD